ncbi:orotate phosphoribosyltransferase [Yunchengibacter salinarum]|uniref:orotate phosphoribosyltransferase n=1 Tax=Yunchengibacter salinarum TaxID=3133399 RepID=UPI0035B6567F
MSSSAETPSSAHESASLQSREAVLSLFREADALLEGHFLLSSGRHSPVYLQCARVLQSPARAARLADAFTARLREHNVQVDLVVSPAMGGIIIGHEVARSLGVDGLFMERKDGRFTLRRGFSIPRGSRILMMEDVVTTGLSSRECIAAIEAAGGTVVAAGCLIDRSGGTADVGLPLTALARIDAPSFAADEVPGWLAEIPAVKPGSRPGH